MLNEWKDYYNNDYIIFSINNGIVNDQYYSTKHILNTYQSKVEFIIENIEDFSFKNDDVENSCENDFHINYAQQVLDVEENDQKENQKPITIEKQFNKNTSSDNKNSENLNKNEEKIKENLKDIKNIDNNDINKKIKENNNPTIERNPNNLMKDEFLKEEDFADNNNGKSLYKEKIDSNKKIANNISKVENNSNDKNYNLLNENEINKEEYNDKNENRYKEGSLVDNINFENKNEKNIKENLSKTNESINLPFSRYDNNKKIDFNNLSTKENEKNVNNNMNKEPNQNTIQEKSSQKDLKIVIDKIESPKEDSKDCNEIYSIKKDNYKKLLNNLKSQDQIDEMNNNLNKNKYFSRIEKREREEFEMKNKKTNKDIYLKDIPDSNKIIDSKENQIYSKDNENENLQISNSLNSNNSHDYNNLNSDNNEIPDYDKYPKISSRAQSYTTRSRDDEIKSLNDKLFSYKNQNKIILDENKKLLEIINIFKILQNLENSKKNNDAKNNVDVVNENLDAYSINRQRENLNKENFIFNNKIESNLNIVNEEENLSKEENNFENYNILNFQNIQFPKNDKKGIKNIHITNANKFLNSAEKSDQIEKIQNLNFNDNSSKRFLKLDYANNLNLQNNLINEEKLIKNENISINNRYDNVNESSNHNIQNNFMISDQIDLLEKKYENQTIFNNRNNIITNNQVLNNLDYQYSYNRSNKNSENNIYTNNYYSNIKNNTNINQNININLDNSNTINSPSNNNDSTKNTNNEKKKTFIKINDNPQTKGGYYSKNIKNQQINILKTSNSKSNTNNIPKKTINRVSYINTNNSNTVGDSKSIPNSIKSSNLNSQKEIIFSDKLDSMEERLRAYPFLSASNFNNINNNKFSDKDLFDRNKIVMFDNTANPSSNIKEEYNNFIQNNIYSNNIYNNEYNYNRIPNNNNSNKQIFLNNKFPDIQFNIERNINNKNSSNNDEKELKNYSNLIQYLEKYRELNDRLIETLENEKNDVKIDINKRKRDVEYLEHVLNYISSLGENKEAKDFIPFYLIDKRKLFENMVKYLYSKDEMTHSTKPKNVRLYKVHNKLK